jgi:hypothetical protein
VGFLYSRPMGRDECGIYLTANAEKLRTAASISPVP